MDNGYFDYLTQTPDTLSTAQAIFDYAKQYLDKIGPTYSSMAVDYLNPLTVPEAETASTPEGKMLMSLVQQMMRQAQPVKPLQVGPFAVTPKGRMAMQQQELQALSTPAQFLYNLFEEQQRRNAERQMAAAQLAANMGLGLDQLMTNANLATAGMISDLGLGSMQLSNQASIASGNQAATIMDALIRANAAMQAAAANAVPEWTQVLGTVPGIVDVLGNLGDIPGLSGLEDLLGSLIGGIVDPITDVAGGLIDFIGGLF